MTNSALRLTFAFLAAFFIISIINPFVFLGIVFWTGGLAIPLMFLNTVLIYFLAALPALIGMRTYNWRLIGCSAVLIPLVAVVPPLISQVLTFKHMQRLLSDDIGTDFPEIPKSIEVSEPREGVNFLGGDAPCQDLCQRLLLSRQVEVVRVMKAKGPGGFDYRLEQHENCPDTFALTPLMLPESKDAFVSGTCFVAQESDSTPVTARIEIRKTSFPEPLNLIQNLSRVANAVKTIQVLTISVAGQGRWSPQLQRTKATFSYWRMPLVVGVTNFRSVERTLNDFDLDQFALRTLGIKERDPKDRLGPAARVMAVLDHIGKGPTGNQDGIIADWVNSLPSCKPQACPPVTGEDKEVLLRLIKDRRIRNFGIGQVLSRNLDFATDNLDLLLDQMVARGANSEFSNEVGAIIALLDIDKVRERRDRIVTLLRDNDWARPPRGIGILSGRLGIDTTDVILERLRGPASAYTAALAACMADVAVGQQLVPSVLDYLRASIHGFSDRYAIKAVARFGHFEEIKELTRARYPKLAEQFAQQKGIADIANDISLCDAD